MLAIALPLVNMQITDLFFLFHQLYFYNKLVFTSWWLDLSLKMSSNSMQLLNDCVVLIEIIFDYKLEDHSNYIILSKDFT